MTAPFDNIVQHLFHQPSLQSVTMEELERLVLQNPSFAAAQFLLLKKMQQTDHPDFNAQLLKTTLYFNNPLWLQFLLQPQREKAIVKAEREFAAVRNTDENRSPSSTATHIEEENSTVHTTDIEEAPEPDLPVEPAHELVDTTRHETTTSIAEEFNYQAVTETQQPAWTASTPSISQEPVSAIELAEEYNYQKNGTENTETHQPIEPVGDINDKPVETVEGSTLPEDEPKTTSDEITEPNVQQAAAQLIKTVIETPAAKDDLLFEPYHTIDYFASQGIKLGKMELQPTDKLGRQLKSFTEWLKVMKKLPQASVDKILAENDETKVVEAANHSIESKEVITEAMAEVFEKQGLHEKATEVYEKLSLLNPSKSAYFASRIEALKQQ